MHCELRRRLGDDEGRDYDARVLASPAGHAAQTRAWAELAIAGAPVQARFALVRDGARVVGAGLVLRPVVLGLPMPWAWLDRGPVVDELGQLGDVTRALLRALRRQGVARVRVSPYWTDAGAERAEGILGELGMGDVQTADGPHARTLRLRLDVPEASLFSGKSKEQVRWRSRQAERAGATARRGQDADWPRFHQLYRDLMRSQGRGDKPAGWWDALRRFASDDTRGALFACDFEGMTVAACVVLRHGPLATYAWGASVADKLPFSKAIPALVAGIRWARGVGCSTFDLGGIPLEGDTDAKRAAIATFKYDFDRTPVRLVREHAGWC